MRQVAVEQAGAAVAELVESIERGEEILLTRDGRPVARLVRERASAAEKNARAAFDALLSIRDQLAAEGVSFSMDELLSMRDEGRRY